MKLSDTVELRHGWNPEIKELYSPCCLSAYVNHWQTTLKVYNFGGLIFLTNNNISTTLLMILGFHSLFDYLTITT